MYGISQTLPRCLTWTTCVGGQRRTSNAAANLRSFPRNQLGSCVSVPLSLLLSLSHSSAVSLALLALSVCMHALPAGWQRQFRGGGDSSDTSSAGCLFSQHAVRLFFVTFARFPFCFAFSFLFLYCLICFCYCCCYCCCLIK